MARVLLLILLVWVLYVVIKRVIASPYFKNTQSNSESERSHSDEKMVQCEKCGMHVPTSESLIKNDQVICNNPDCSSD